MIITFQLPDELERDLRLSIGDLNAAAREMVLVSLYRQGWLTHVALARALGRDRFETEELLHKYGVTEDLGTVDEFLKDVETLEQLRAKHSR
jgi:hypothetical protein